MVSDETRDAYNKIAKIYDEKLWYDMPYNKQMDKFVSYVQGKDIIDLGCAMGSFTKYVADKGYNVDGIDIAEKFIEIAEEKVKNVHFEVMDMLDLKVSKKYDGVMAINSIVHIEKKNMLELLKNFCDILKENGVLFLIILKGVGEHYVVEPLDTSVKEFVNYYQMDEIEPLFEQSGFDIISKEDIRDDAEFEIGNDQIVYYLRKRG